MNILGLADRIFGPSERKASFKGHHVAVKASISRIELYVDGKKVASAKPSFFPTRDAAVVTAPLRIGKQRHVIEVYGRSGFWQPRIKICVDEQQVGGDEF